MAFAYQKLTLIMAWKLENVIARLMFTEGGVTNASMDTGT